MTTVSVVECISPVSLRSCGSSVSTLLKNRKKLQCIRGYKVNSEDRSDSGLEGTLLSSPIPSPIPRATVSLYGGRASRHESPSMCSDEFCDDELDEEIQRTQANSTPDLFVVGSKPRLHGMWEIQSSLPVTPSNDRQSVIEDVDDVFNRVVEDRSACSSPDNPPPSPINFRPGMDGFVVGGQKLMCPERCQSSPGSYNRDFNPGFVKQVLHHCAKCEGRVIEEELSQVTLHRRLSSILSSHASKQNFSEEALKNYKIQTKSMQIHMSGQLATHAVSEPAISSGEKSFYEIYTEKKRLREEKELLLKEKRERRKEERRIDELEKLTQRLRRKEERSQALLKRATAARSGQLKQVTSEIVPDAETVKDDKPYAELCTPNGGEELQLPPISTKVSTPPHSANAAKKELTYLECLSFMRDEGSGSSSVGKEKISENVRRYSRHSWSDVLVANTALPDHPYKATATYTDERKKLDNENTMSPECTGASPACLSSSKRYMEKCNTSNMETNATTTMSASVSKRVPMSNDENAELQRVPNCKAEEICAGTEETMHNPTMSSTLIVPDRDTSSTQWISFNGDNEPILNTSPEVDDTCDTFLKRLQRAKQNKQNDAPLPSGQQFCFEAMVDKRYNRWKRRRRKKHSEARRTHVVQGSESSDENDERNKAMERIIDRMYEEINGPAPHTPNGSRDTPRTRNRRRRKNDSSVPRTPENDVHEQESSVTLYDASSEWTSDGCPQSSSSLHQIPRVSDETVLYEPEQETELETPQDRQSETIPDDLCSWSYLEQYKSEILKRLKDTPPDQLEDLDKNDWLPDIQDNTARDHIPDNYNVDTNTVGSVTPEKRKQQDDSQSISSLIVVHHIPNKAEFYIGSHEHAEIPEDTISIADIESETEKTPEEYEPYIRVTETPRHTPVPAYTDNQEASKREVPIKTCEFDPSKQKYSYTKWTRSQKSVAKKLCSLEQRPRLLSRTNASSWSEIGCDQGLNEDTGGIEVTNKEMDKNQYRPIKHQEIFQSKDRSAKKRQKVALNIKKHNVNLPSLTKNSSCQTMPDFRGKGQPEKTDNFPKVKSKPTKDNADRHRKHVIPYDAPTNVALKESQTSPGVVYKDRYLRTLYGYKTRINSHVDSKHDKGLRKTLTVDNLESLARKSQRKSDISKPSDLAFTRSFTFSMFDLPEVYKLYNTSLERRAAGEEVEAQ